MNKSQGRIQAGSVPVRRGGRGGSLLQGGAVYYVAKCPGGHSTTGDRLLRDRSRTDWRALYAARDSGYVLGLGLDQY